MVCTTSTVARLLAGLLWLAAGLGCGRAEIFLGSDRSDPRASHGGQPSAEAGVSDGGPPGHSGSGEPGGRPDAGTGSGNTGTPGSDAGLTSPPVSGCTAGFGDCDGSARNGCETDLSTSLAHCGACGATCSIVAFDVVGSTCAQGRCQPVCELAHVDCDGNPANGCEVNTLFDAQNCGACGVVCPCSGGACN